MLDKRTEYLLGYINSKCAEGCFNVLSKKELLNSLPARFKADEDLLRQMLTGLKLGGFVEIRYEDELELCLAPTIKGRAAFEDVSDRSERRSDIGGRYFIFTFAAVFFGITLSVLFLKAVAAL